jgi:hypothetical protein
VTQRGLERYPTKRPPNKSAPAAMRANVRMADDPLREP